MSMRIVTINLPDAYLDAIKSLIKLGFYNNRSHIVREALKEFIEREKSFTEELKLENFQEIKSQQLKKLETISNVN